MNLAIAKSQSFEGECEKIGLELTHRELNVLKRYIPETLLWGPKALDDRYPEELREYVSGNIREWVVKSFHGKGGEEFIDGSPADGIAPNRQFRDAWSDKDKDYVAQRRQEHGFVKVPMTDEQNPGEVKWGSEPVHTGCICD